MKKSVTSVALFISFISMLIIAGIAQLSQEELYSNKKAYQCFTQNLSQCAQTLDPSCQQVSSQCVKQLSKLSCSFSQDDRIHNGACFRQWEQKAIQTKGFVQCLNSKCAFKYNSAITIQNLEKCTQKTLFQMRAECDDICIDKIRIIHERMTRMPLQTAYSVPLVEDNQAAKKIVQRIRELCIFGDYSQQQNQFESQQPVAQNENEKSKQSQL